VVLASRKPENLEAGVARLRPPAARRRPWRSTCATRARAGDGRAGGERARAHRPAREQRAGNFYAPSESLSPNAWRSVVEIDLYGTFFCSQAVLPAMKAQGGGAS
jgi:peroxisomal 2,4-dienoyl-CoA reductase